MKTIGLIGGMSWESSAQYYAIVNRETMRRLGHPHSARTVLLSLDFGEIARLQSAGEWDTLGAMLADEARRIEAAGADCLLICTNRMHLFADTVAEAVSIPLLHIADAAGEASARRASHASACSALRSRWSSPSIANGARASGWT